MILGLSGGIDSAVVAAIAVDALGPEQVYGVSMPERTPPSTPATTPPSWPGGTGLHFRIEPIQPMVDAFLSNVDAVRAGGGEPAGPGPRRDPDGDCPTRTATWCSPPATRASWRSATPPSTATRWAASTRSRTCRRRWSGGWPGGATPRRPGAARRRRSRRTRSPSRPAPSCARASSTATRCRLRRCSTRSWPTTSTATSAGPTCSPPGTTRPWSTGCCGWWTWPSTSAASPRPGRRSRIKAFGRDRRLPITNRLARTPPP